MIARRSGVCPVCNRYIVAHRSQVRRLPQAIRPQRPRYIRDVRVGTVQDTRRRSWVHAKCYATGEALIAERVA